MAAQDDTVKVLLLLTQGFEDLEAVAILDVFAWTHYGEHIQKASVTTAGFHFFILLVVDIIMEVGRNYVMSDISISTEIRIRLEPKKIAKAYFKRMHL